MTLLHKAAAVGLAVAMAASTVGVASARPIHHRHVVRHGGYHHYAYRRGYGGDVAGAAIAGTALGLIGAGIAGATAADSGYGYGYPAYGYGGYGGGYYGPGYGYPGY